MAEEPAHQSESSSKSSEENAERRCGKRIIAEHEVAAFVATELLSSDRTQPVVAVTTPFGATQPLLDPDALAKCLGERARVVLIETGPGTQVLGRALPPQLGVYGGAIRVWHPGLTLASKPADHPLIFVRADQVELAQRRILRGLGIESEDRRPAVHHGDGYRGDPKFAAASSSAARGGRMTRMTKTSREILTGTIESIEGQHVRVRTSAGRGIVKFADFPLIDLAKAVKPGDTVQVFHLDVISYGPLQYSVQGLMPRPASGGATAAEIPRPSPSFLPVQLRAPSGTSSAAKTALSDPWARIAELFRSGDVARGRVCCIEKLFVLIEVLPGAAMICPIREMDWQFVADPSALFTVGEVVRVIVLSIDADKRKGVVSIKRAYAEPWPAPVSLVDGGPPFLPETPVALAIGEDQFGQLRAQLEGTERENKDLQRSLAEARTANAALRKSIKEDEGRIAAFEQAAADDDPGSSSNAFLRAVRIEYARQFDESDRMKYPLARMRVGSEFMDRLAEIEGVSMRVIVKVCCQVAAGRAHEVPARQVHQLHQGQSGTKVRVRTADSAVAWRCSLQDGTASARRLHWWDIPGGASGVQRTIEFATVNLHDDDSI